MQTVLILFYNYVRVTVYFMMLYNIIPHIWKFLLDKNSPSHCITDNFFCQCSHILYAIINRGQKNYSFTNESRWQNWQKISSGATKIPCIWLTDLYSPVTYILLGRLSVWETMQNQKLLTRTCSLIRVELESRVAVTPESTKSIDAELLTVISVSSAFVDVLTSSSITG